MPGYGENQYKLKQQNTHHKCLAMSSLQKVRNSCAIREHK